MRERRTRRDLYILAFQKAINPMRASESNVRLGLAIVLAAAWIALTGAVGAQTPGVDLGGQLSVSPKAFAKGIEDDLSEIRGLPFKKEIDVQNQSAEDFDAYMDEQLSSQIPAEKLANLGTIARVAGLHRGEAFDYVETVKLLMGSQAAAYYDPKKSAFFVVKSEMPELFLGGIYAHELYHGLQDQYFDLQAYYGWDNSGYQPNDDEMLARQSVVEGEAMYVMQLWTLQNMMGGPADPAMLQVGMQQMAQLLEGDALMGFIRSNAAAGMLGDPKEAAEMLSALEETPRFMVETLLGAYLRGMIFVAEMHRGGWPAVERLYAHPPASSEMILHPEKYAADEVPSRIAFPELKSEPALKGWTVLEDNALGEVQLGIIFKEYELPDIGRVAAAGWDGDRYAVLEQSGTGAHMLLLATRWDSEAEAAEFAGAYGEVARVKDKETGRTTRIVHEGAAVHVAEAPAGGDLDALIEVVRKSRVEK